MKCLYCGKRLALLRKLTDSEFCTDAHRRAFQREQEQMALARLSDSGKGKKRAEAEKPVPELKDEPGFVDWKHRAAEWTGKREIASEPIAAETVQLLPEDSVQLQAYPVEAGRLPMESLQGNPKAAAWAAGEPVPEPAEMEILRPAARVKEERREAGRVALCAIGVRAVGSGKASLVEAFGPMTGQLSPRMPAFGDDRLIRMPAAKDVAVQLSSLESALATHSVGEAPFNGKVRLSRLGRQLQIAERDAGERGPGQNTEAKLGEMVVALRRPEACAGKAGPRKVRPRELFFPLPRLGDLSTTASRLGGQNIAITPQSGVNGRNWKPGAVGITFRQEIREDRTGKGAPGFPAAEAEWACAPQHLPRLFAGRPGERVLATGPRLDGVSLFLAGEPASAAGVPRSSDVAAEPMGSGIAMPLLWAWMPETALGVSLQLDALTPGVVTAAYGLRACAYAAGPLKATEPCLPAASSVMARLALPMDSRRTMAPLAVEAAQPPAPAMCGTNLEMVASAAKVEAVFPSSAVRQEFEPGVAGKVVPMASGNGVPYPENTVAIEELAPVWPDPEFLYPQSRNTVVEDSAMREAVRAMSALLAEQNRSLFGRLRLPSFSRGDSKWLVMSVPAILLLSLYLLTEKGERPDLDSLPQVAEIVEEQQEAQSEPEPVAAVQPKAVEPKAVDPKAVEPKRAAMPAPSPEAASPVAVAEVKPAGGGDGSFLGGIQQTILRRAAVNLSDDFRSGLGDWEGEGDWSKQWSYDAAGFLHTGPLILYKPSLALTDYRMEFLGRIEKRAMGWVYRATDRKNYYAHKIVLTKGGPLPTAVVERYAVIGGKTHSLARRPLPMQVHVDASYRVRMDVSGNGFTLSVQGQIVDHWSDDRLQTGGVGFFSARGEQASLRWVELSHQHDFLGRLCAFLAPYSLPAKEGSLR